MSSVELIVTVQDERTVRARNQDGKERSCKIEPDRLRRDTIKIFEDWLNQSKISKRDELEVLGAHLYRLIFNGAIEKFFEEARGEVPPGERLRIQLSFQEEASELARLPWEYLYCPDTETREGFFLSTNVDLVLSRYIPFGEGRQPLGTEDDHLRILVAVSQPADRVPVIANPVLEAIEKLSDIEIHRLYRPTVGDFLEQLRKVKPHVLHFIGHGRFNRAKEKGEIALLEQDEKGERWIGDKEFTEYFKQVRWTPRLVFLHLCEGATVEFEANFSRLAPQLIRAGVPAVVAMQYPISNEAAVAFSRAFYRELANGGAVDHAVQTGRWGITVDVPNAYDSRVFGTPVLYMHSRDGIIRPKSKVEMKQSLSGSPLQQANIPARSETKPPTVAERAQPKPMPAQPAGDSFNPGVKSFDLTLNASNPEVKLFDLYQEAEARGGLQRQLTEIFYEAGLSVNEMDLEDAQKQGMKERLTGLRKDLGGKTMSGCREYLSAYLDFESDPRLKVIWAVMVEKMK